MPYFKVDELFELCFDKQLSYVLPESVNRVLTELESLLEIPDPATIEQPEKPEKREYKSDSRRFSSNENHPSQKYRNRYDIESTPFVRAEKDNKKRDFRKKDGHSMSAVASTRDETEVDKEWEMMRAFKATKIESKTGIEKTVNDLRISLNKISGANYEKQRDVIMALVNGYFDAEEEKTDSNTRRISKAIFDIASTNKFYSEIYARLYKELATAHTVFSDLLQELIEGFMVMDTIPVYIDPDSDYDGFCAYSKACDIRKSTSTFLVNCLKLELIASSRVADVLSEFVRYVDVKRNEPGFAKCVEEVVENLYIIATLCSNELSITKKWTEYILPRFKQYVAEKNNGCPSMSNRAIFKLQDLLEKL
jgi:hypothetical protein